MGQGSEWGSCSLCCSLSQADPSERLADGWRIVWQVVGAG